MTPDADVDVADTDQDGDGVLDATDNCKATPNADQRDHDGDGHGDACDHCPHLADATDPDSDGDGVGDACDPRPTIAGDRVVLWEGFYTADSLAAWSTGGAAGNWHWSNGTVAQDVMDAGDRVLLTNATYQHIYTATGFRVLGLGSPATIGTCSGVITPPLTRFICCTVRTSGPTVQASSQIDAMQAPWPGTFATGDSIMVVHDTSTTNRCAASEGTVNAFRTATLGATDGRFQLYTASASAAFDFVFIVEIGN